MTQFCSPLYYGTEIARDLGLSPEGFLPGWRATELDRTTGKLTFEETMEQLMKSHGVYSPEKHRQVVQAAWYRQTAFEHKQAALRPDFVQIAEPMELLKFVNAS